MAIIGLTGGPGAGKSLAAEYLKKLGAVVISGDDAGREVIASIPSVLKKLVRAFGREILNPDGTLDRGRLATIVFGDRQALLTLNSIVHPPLLKIIKKKIEGSRREFPRKVIVVDAALIFEWGIANWFDYILVIAASRDIRLERMVNGGLSKKAASDRIASQIPQKDKIKLADYIIENNGTRTGVKKKILSFWEILNKFR